VQDFGQPRPLGLASDQSYRTADIGRSPSLVPQAVHKDRAALAAKQPLAQSVGPDARLGRADRQVVEECFAGLGQLLEASRGRHAITGQCHRMHAGEISRRRHDLAGGDADSKRERSVGAFSEARQGRLHFEGAQARPQGVVVMSFRSAEDGQNRVPDELLERPAIFDDGLAENRQCAVDSGPNLLRIELVDESRVSDKIGEEGGHDSPVADFETD
jgi:hypothetical protein